MNIPSRALKVSKTRKTRNFLVESSSCLNHLPQSRVIKILIKYEGKYKIFETSHTLVFIFGF